MNETSEKNCKIKSLCKSFGGLTVRSDYDVGIKVFADKDPESPKMNTAVKGTVKVSFFKLMAFFIGLSFVLCMLSSLCRLFRR